MSDRCDRHGGRLVSSPERQNWASSSGVLMPTLATSPHKSRSLWRPCLIYSVKAPGEAGVNPFVDGPGEAGV